MRCRTKEQGRGTWNWWASLGVLVSGLGLVAGDARAGAGDAKTGDAKTGDGKGTQVPEEYLVGSRHRCSDPVVRDGSSVDYSAAPVDGEGTVVSELVIPANSAKRRAVLSMPKMPSTRSYCVFDAQDGDDSATVEWDPLEPRSLIRFVTLHPDSTKETRYKLSCYAEPARHALKPNVNFAWRFSDMVCDRRDKYTVLVCDDPGTETTPRLRCDQKRSTEGETIGNLRVEFKELPALNGASFDSFITTAASQVPLSGARSYGPISEEAVSELFQVIAEVAVERAQSKGMKLIQTKVKALVCDELKFEYELPNGTQRLTVKLDRTCQALETIRLQDLATAGRQLFDALAEDLLRISLLGLSDAPITSLVRLVGPTEGDWVVKQTLTKLAPFEKEFKPVVDMTIELAADVIRGKRETLHGGGQRILVALARATANTMRPALEAGHAHKDVLAFAFAAMAECHRMGRCDAATIDRMIANPAEYFRWDPIQGHKVHIQQFLKGPLEKPMQDILASIGEVLKLQESASNTFIPVGLSEPLKGLRGTLESITKTKTSIDADLKKTIEASASIADIAKAFQSVKEVMAMMPEVEQKIRLVEAELKKQTAPSLPLTTLTSELKAFAQALVVANATHLQHVSSEKTDLADLKSALGQWSNAPAFINAGLKVLSPPAGTTDIEQARAVVTLLSEVLAQYGLRAYSQAWPMHERPMNELQKRKFEREYSSLVTMVRDVLIAALEQDLGRLVTSGQKLIDRTFLVNDDDKQKRDRERFTRLAGAVAAYLSTYATNGKQTEADLSARREARKAAVSSLIDAQTARGLRVGQGIFSVGVSPSMFLGWGRPVGLPKSEQSPTEPAKPEPTINAGVRFQPLSLPLGAAFDYNWDCHYPVGIHLELSPVNLGNYIVVQKDQTTTATGETTSGLVPPSPADAISPSFTVAATFLVKDADAIFMLGFNGGYAYKLGNTGSSTDKLSNAELYRGFYGGVVLGTYIPFFDFN